MVVPSSSPHNRIKGIREGLLVMLGDGPYEDVVRALAAELAEKQEFLQGSRVVLDVGGRHLDEQRLAEVQAVLAARELELWTVLADLAVTKEAARALELATRLPGSNTDLEGNVLAPAGDVTSPAPPSEPASGPAANTLLLRETLRSGRSVFHEGHVVIIGDVNPGAEVMAGGNVVVWGRLRGLVHAGAMGNLDAVICALELSPTQLRIASQIAIPPEDRRDQMPEMAAVRDGQIVATPWRVRQRE